MPRPRRRLRPTLALSRSALRSAVGEGDAHSSFSPVQSIPISLEVWPVSVPTTAEAQVQHDWNFGAEQLLQFYPEQQVAEVAHKWWKFMEDHRIPPMDSTAWNCPTGSTNVICQATAKDGSSFLAGKTKVLVGGMSRHNCTCSSCPVEAARQNAIAMQPLVATVKSRAKGAALLAYGFDEAPRSCEKSIRTAFG